MGISSSKNKLSRQSKTSNSSQFTRRQESIKSSNTNSGAGLNPLKKQQSTRRECINEDTWNGPSTVKYVVGVDFGTTYSGFGVIQVAEGQTINSYTNWHEQTPGYVSPKVPSLLQYKISQSADEKPIPHHFGYAAKVHSLTPHTRRAENFKVAIAVEVARQKGIPLDDNGIIPKIPDRLTVVECIADYLKELYAIILLTIETTHSVPTPNIDELFFCFSMPVLWGIDHQEIMRNAIHSAGYTEKPDSTMLAFCHEPEAAAASFFKEFSGNLTVGTRALIVDVGGGTVDLFNCLLDGEGFLDQITVSDGALYGGSLLDQHFTEWLAFKIGFDAVDDLTNEENQKETFALIYGTWDHFKRIFRIDERDWADGKRVKRIRLPASFTRIISTEHRDCLEDGESLIITLEDMIGIFDPVVDKIVDMVSNQIWSLEPDKHGKVVDYLLLVGGFCGSPYLRTKMLTHPSIKDTFYHCPAINQPEGAVLRGATWIAYNQRIIKSRRSKLTIGIKSVRTYDPSIDSAHDAFILNVARKDTFNVYKNFHTIVKRGESIQNNSTVYSQDLNVHVDATSGSHAMANIELYATTQDVGEGMDITDDSCSLLGVISIKIQIEPGQSNVPLKVTIDYGSVEIWATVTNYLTGKQVRTNLCALTDILL